MSDDRKSERYEAGMAVRRQVLGDAHVDRATAQMTEFDADFQTFITEGAWGSVWSRPHFSKRERSIVTIALLAALGQDDEVAMHVRATRNTGATRDDIREALLHVAVYAGVPAANHAFYLRNCYLENRLSAGTMEVGGIRLNLRKSTVPVYNLATREDHIAPPRSVFYGSSFFGGKVTFVLTGSGHIAGVINPPARNKYQYWTGPAPKGDGYDGWLAKAKEHPGSWWPHWQRWIESRDATTVKARRVGNRKFKPIEPAPGKYAKERL